MMPSRAPSSHREREPDWRLWLLAWPAATLLLAVSELVLLSDVVSDSLSACQSALLPLVLAGNLLAYSAVGALAFGLASRAYVWFGRFRRRRRWFILAALVAGLPYALRVSYYTFSGPRMLDLALRPWLIAGGTLVIALLSLGAFALAVWTPTRRLWRSLLACGLIAAAAISLGLSAATLPNEYEPLHAFLMVLAIASSTLGVAQLLRGRVRLGLPGTAAVLGLATVWAGASTWTLAKNHEYAWVVWGGTPGSRYVTHRLTVDEKLPEVVALDQVPATWARDERWSQQREQRRREPAPHIVVFSVDNLQPDHVGAYGYRDNPTTPNIDRIARGGVVFERAYSYYPQTRIFMSSMLFGKKTGPFGRHRAPSHFQRSSLTRLLKQRNYRVLVKGVFELTAHREFNPAHYGIDTWLRRATAEEIRSAKTIPHIPLQERFAQLDEHLREAKRREQPVFIWMHFLRPHRHGGSFSNHEDFDFGQDRVARYDSAVAATDRWLAKIEALMRRHLGDAPTIWVIQSDHGAGLWQGERERGKNLLNDHVHVPLIIAAPGVPAGRVSVPVDSAVDTAATLLDLVGITPPTSYDGASLVPILLERGMQLKLRDRAIYLEQARWQGAVWQQYKLIEYRGAVSLFDVVTDPRERHNLAAQHPEVVERLQRSIHGRAQRIRQRFRQ